MSIPCSVFGHIADMHHHRNEGVEFSHCDRCGEDLIRLDGSEGGWSAVPQGYRVVWRRPAYRSDALSVAERMERLAKESARRRAERKRLRPLTPPVTAPSYARRTSGGMLSVVTRLALAGWGERTDENSDDEGGTTPPVIRLPGC